MFGLLLRFDFVRLLVDGVEHRLGNFRLPTLRDDKWKVLVQLLVLLGQLCGSIGNKERDKCDK